MAQWNDAALKLVIAITTLTLATASQRSSGILNRNQEPFTAIDQGFKSLTEAASTGQKHRRLASDDTANCASAKGTSCFTYTASDKPQLFDMMTLLAADLATKAYNTSAVGIDYVKSVLGAADARFIQDSATGTQVLVAIDDAAVIISFRGTEPTKSADKKTNTLVELVPTSFGSAGTGSVHKGFLQALESVYSDLSSLLREENSERNKKIYFTGHSLGSALATLAAAKVQADTSLGQSVSGVYSLAGPRVGDASWAEAYSELGLDARTLRIVYYKDGVPLIPPESMDYTHVGRTTILPMDDSTCFETAEQEYDVCETDKNIFDFVATLTAKFACAAFENIVIGGYCAISSNAYAATMCPFLDLDSLKGNLCCAAIEAGIQYLDGSQTFLEYHSADRYYASIAKGCTPDCAYQQYQECGGGWTPEDEALVNAPALTDPVQSLTEAEAQEAFTQGGSPNFDNDKKDDDDDADNNDDDNSSSPAAVDSRDTARQGSSSTAACITRFTIISVFSSTFFFLNEDHHL